MAEYDISEALTSRADTVSSRIKFSDRQTFNTLPVQIFNLDKFRIV
ncbi:MAG: hypothetical protein J6I96_03725 [Oscillospiraceae bacterium]|nr:hypothetical protein [Oscillospiraceae bacterium]